MCSFWNENGKSSINFRSKMLEILQPNWICSFSRSQKSQLFGWIVFNWTQMPCAKPFLFRLMMWRQCPDYILLHSNSRRRFCSVCSDTEISFDFIRSFFSGFLSTYFGSSTKFIFFGKIHTTVDIEWAKLFLIEMEKFITAIWIERMRNASKQLHNSMIFVSTKREDKMNSLWTF